MSGVVEMVSISPEELRALLNRVEQADVMAKELAARERELAEAKAQIPVDPRVAGFTALAELGAKIEAEGKALRLAATAQDRCATARANQAFFKFIGKNYGEEVKLHTRATGTATNDFLEVCATAEEQEAFTAYNRQFASKPKS